MPAFGVAADFVVELAGRIADLAHVAEYQYLAADGRGQHVDAGAHRIGIGVVGIVEHHRTVDPGAPLQAALDTARKAARPALIAAIGNPAATVAAIAASALRALWRPGRPGRPPRTDRRFEAQFVVQPVQGWPGADIRRRIETETQHLAAGIHFLPQRRLRSSALITATPPSPRPA